MNILVIDDENDILQLLAKTIEHGGYTVTTTNNIPDAEQLILKNDYDLVVSDVMIPHLGGFELVELIKTKKNIPVILLTGMDKDILDTTLTGADAVLIKPVNGKQLLDTIKEKIAAKAVVK